MTTNRPFKAKYLARTHARAVSGNITSMKFDAQTGKFELRYELDLTIKMPSEIFMSTEYYYHREEVTFPRAPIVIHFCPLHL